MTERPANVMTKGDGFYEHHRYKRVLSRKNCRAASETRA